MLYDLLEDGAEDKTSLTHTDFALRAGMKTECEVHSLPDQEDLLNFWDCTGNAEENKQR